MKHVEEQKGVFSLNEQDIHTQPLLLQINSTVRAGGTACETRSRSESQACCDNLSNVGPVVCEDDIGGEYCFCKQDVGTGDWD